MPETVLHRYPIRGAIWGLVFGLGVSLLLIAFSLVPLTITNLIMYTAIVMVVSILWSVSGPPKKPAGYATSSAPPPAVASQE